MTKINSLRNKKNINKKIINDLINFQKIDKNNKISILPDVHLKRGEMSPTGCVLVSDKITPSFTHLSVGSGISVWSIEVEKNFKIEKFNKLFKYLHKKIPGSNEKNKKLHNFSRGELIKCFKEGANFLVRKKLLKKFYLKNIENQGNFAKNITNFFSPDQTIPDYIKKICLKNFGTLGTGNTFIELHKIKKNFTKIN